MKTYTFKSKLIRPEGVGTWHFIDTPIHVEKEFGKKGKVRIIGKINTIDFSGTLIPRGNGEHYIVLDKKIRDAVGIKVGDELLVEIREDKTERKVDVSKGLK